MSDAAQPKTTDPAPKLHLDRTGFTTAGALHGEVRVQLWLEGGDDPLNVWMSPGQAMDLIQKLAWAAQTALKGAVAP